MLSKAKHPFDETSSIYAQGIPHFVRNDRFPVKVERTFFTLAGDDRINIAIAQSAELHHAIPIELHPPHAVAAP